MASAGAPSAAGRRPWLHLRGFLWEAKEKDVREAVLPALRAVVDCSLTDCFLPLDGRARPSGEALVQVGCCDGTEAALVDALHGLAVGSRYLEARICSDDEVELAKSRSVQATQSSLAPQAFLGAARSARPGPPAGIRELVVLCHGAPDTVARGAFELNDLPAGRVDLLARCASAALFYSHGVRKQVRLWLMLRDSGRTICCDGSVVRGLRPDERSIAAALRRVLRAAPPEGATAAAAVTATATAEAEGMEAEADDRAVAAAVATVDGWSVHDSDRLEARLRWLRRGAGADGTGADGTGAVQLPLPLLQLHEAGEPLEAVLGELPRRGTGGAAPATAGCVLVLGDHVGFTAAEEAALLRVGVRRCALGATPLLTSQCIVLLHYFLDALHAGVRVQGQG